MHTLTSEDEGRVDESRPRVNRAAGRDARRGAKGCGMVRAAGGGGRRGAPRMKREANWAAGGVVSEDRRAINRPAT
ncbi:MAG: hypothetical protein M3220_15780 [Chloroflexota bacterium]|nr:hypothetical protein [Chloroflexota bacterium]